MKNKTVMMVAMFMLIAGYVNALNINDGKTCYLSAIDGCYGFTQTCPYLSSGIQPIINYTTNKCMNPNNAIKMYGNTANITYNLASNHSITSVTARFCPTDFFYTCGENKYFVSPVTMKVYTSNDGTLWTERGSTNAISSYSTMTITPSSPVGKWVRVQLQRLNNTAGDLNIVSLDIQGIKLNQFTPTELSISAINPSKTILLNQNMTVTVRAVVHDAGFGALWMSDAVCSSYTNTFGSGQLPNASGNYYFNITGAEFGVGDHDLNACGYDSENFAIISSTIEDVRVIGSTPTTLTTSTTISPYPNVNSTAVCVNFTLAGNDSAILLADQIDSYLLENSIKSDHLVTYDKNGVCRTLQTTNQYFTLTAQKSGYTHTLTYMTLSSARAGKNNSYTFISDATNNVYVPPYNGNPDDTPDNPEKYPTPIPSKFSITGLVSNTSSDELEGIRVIPDCSFGGNHYGLYATYTNETGQFTIVGVTPNSRCKLYYQDNLRRIYEDNVSDSYTIVDDTEVKTMKLHLRKPADDSVTYTVKAFELVDDMENPVNDAIVTFIDCGGIQHSKTQKAPSPGYITFTTSDLSCDFGISCQKKDFQSGSNTVEHSNADKYYPCQMNKNSNDQNHLTISLVNGKNNPIINGNITCYLKSVEGTIKGQTYSNALGEAYFNLEPETNYDVSCDYNGIKKTIRVTIDSEGQSATYIIDYKEDITSGTPTQNLSNFIYGTLFPLFQIILLLFAFSVLFKVLIGLGQ